MMWARSHFARFATRCSNNLAATRLTALAVALAVAAPALLTAPAAQASSPGLQVNPLKYEQTLLGNQVRSGFVDVANPSDTTITVTADVQAFRQDDLAGDLAFFDSSRMREGIKLGLTQFQLGPRQAIRDSFSVDPTKLPKGGVYAVIFFRTVPPPQSSSSSFVAESANVGTLLLLQNGPANAHIGGVTRLALPFWQLGAGISGTARYQNTNRTTAPIAFSPRLALRVTPWGQAAKLAGPYVLPGSTREFQVSRPGSYLGLLPVSLMDQDSGVARTTWVFACTGGYAFAVIFLLCFAVIWVFSRLSRRQSIFPRRRRHTAESHRSLDGLMRKSS